MDSKFKVGEYVKLNPKYSDGYEWGVVRNINMRYVKPYEVAYITRFGDTIPGSRFGTSDLTPVEIGCELPPAPEPEQPAATPEPAMDVTGYPKRIQYLVNNPGNQLHFGWQGGSENKASHYTAEFYPDGDAVTDDPCFGIWVEVWYVDRHMSEGGYWETEPHAHCDTPMELWAELRKIGDLRKWRTDAEFKPTTQPAAIAAPALVLHEAVMVAAPASTISDEDLEDAYLRLTGRLQTRAKCKPETLKRIKVVRCGNQLQAVLSNPRSFHVLRDLLLSARCKVGLYSDNWSEAHKTGCPREQRAIFEFPTYRRARELQVGDMFYDGDQPCTVLELTDAYAGPDITYARGSWRCVVRVTNHCSVLGLVELVGR